MHIDYYAYGTMTVDGKVYSKDLIIFPEKIIADWRRKDGHSLRTEDLKEVFEYEPDFLIVGKGDSGVMCVLDEVKKTAKDKIIELMDKNTHEAVKIFNDLVQKNKKVVGIFHLTC